MDHWQHAIFGEKSRFQLYLVDGRLGVRRLPGEHFQQRCQANRVHAGGGLVHVWGAFHSSAKSPFVLPDRYFTGELYRGILCLDCTFWYSRRHIIAREDFFRLYTFRPPATKGLDQKMHMEQAKNIMETT